MQKKLTITAVRCGGSASRGPNVGRYARPARPSEAVVELAGERNKAMADQVTTAAKSRLVRMEGRLGSSDMAAVDRALRLQLGLER